MEVVPLPTTAEVAVLAAETIERLVAARPDSVLGLATGSSPLPTYQELIRRHVAGTAPSYAAVRVFTLDEYVGLPSGHEQTYLETIARELTDALGIPRDRVLGPDPDPDGLPDAGVRYERSIRGHGGIDLQVLGIGADGHLAFNEPGSSLASLTRMKTLTEQTRQDNARFFGSVDRVPRHVLTQGLGTILRARHLLLVAIGGPQGRGGRQSRGGSPVGLVSGVGAPAASPRDGDRRRGLLLPSPAGSTTIERSTPPSLTGSTSELSRAREAAASVMSDTHVVAPSTRKRKTR